MMTMRFPVALITRPLIVAALAALAALAPMASGVSAREPPTDSDMGEPTTRTSTLLASASADHREQGRLWIRDGEHPSVQLSIDLSALPGWSSLARCTLVMVADDVAYTRNHSLAAASQVLLRARRSSDAQPLVALTTLSADNKVARNTANGELCAAVQSARDAGTPLTIDVFTDTHKASTLLYAPLSMDPSSPASATPRLVLEYRMPPPSLRDSLAWGQLQHSATRQGRSDWRAHSPPVDFTLETLDIGKLEGVDERAVIAHYPVLWRGLWRVPVKGPNGDNQLLSLDGAGHLLDRRELGAGVVQYAPMVSEQGRLTIIIDNDVHLLDLDHPGTAPLQRTLPGAPAGHAKPALAADGSLFIPRDLDGKLTLFGYTPDLTPLLDSGVLVTVDQGPLSTPSLSADGQRLSLQSPAQAWVWTLADPTRPLPLPFFTAGRPGQTELYAPLAGIAPRSWLYGARDGRLTTFNDGELSWSRPSGSLPSVAVIDQHERAWWLERGELSATGLATGTTSCVIPAAASHSNLVMSGEGSLYYWGQRDRDTTDANSDDPTTRALTLFGLVPMADGCLGAGLAVDAPGPAPGVRLALAADGSLWTANLDGPSLFVFRPKARDNDQMLAADQLEDLTRYHSSGRLTIDAGQIPPGARLLLRGDQGTAFAPGVSIPRGTSLMVTTPSP